MIDVRTYGALGNGSNDDITAINLCLQENSVVVIHNGIFIINSSILMPSNTTLYLKNCVVKLGNSKFDNVIRNENQAGNVNIKVIGLGNVELNQNAANNNDTSARTTWGVLNSNSFHYLAVFFCNVVNFELSGLYINEYCAWSTLIQRCSNGVIKDIWINYTTGIANQDGLDIGHGSHDIEISNIQGRSGDDFLAIVSWGDGGFVNRDYMGGDTYNLTFNNIYPYKAGVNVMRVLAGDGGTIKDITISGLKCNLSSYALLSIGADTYPTTPPTNDDIANITIDDAYLGAMTQTYDVLRLYSPCSNFFITNLVNDSGKNLIDTNRTPENIWVNGIQYY